MSSPASQSTSLPTCGENGSLQAERDKERMESLYAVYVTQIDPKNQEEKSRIISVVLQEVHNRFDSEDKHFDAHCHLGPDDPCDWPAGQLSTLGAKTEDEQDDEDTAPSGSVVKSGPSNNNPTKG